MGSRAAVAAVVLGLLVVGAPARAGAPGVTSDVAVRYLGLADYSVSADTVRPLVAPGFTVRPCFGGGSDQADVFVVVTEERYLSLRDVPPEPVHSLSLLTCADPPAQY